MNRSLLAGFVGALAVVVASVAIAAGPHPSFRAITASSWSSRAVSSELSAAAAVPPAPRAASPPAHSIEFTHLDAEQARLLTTAEWSPEAVAAQAATVRTPIPCFDITINFAEDDLAGVSAQMRLRANDLDGNGVIESEGTAGIYNLFLGVDEVAECTLTIYLNGVVEAVQVPVVDSAFQNASYFLFRWDVGSSFVEHLDSGSDIGPFVNAGENVGGPADSAFFGMPQGSGLFPYYDIASGPCVCADSVCTTDAIAREGELDDGFSGQVPYDTTNGGCFSDANGLGFLTTPIALGDKVCGQSSANFLGRDTDWYQFSLPEPRTLTVRVRAAFDMQLFVLNVSPDMCDHGFDVFGLGIAPRCQNYEVTFGAPSGEFILFCAPAFNQTVSPGSTYQLELIDSTACGAPVYDFDAVAREVETDCDFSLDSVNGGCNDPSFPTTPIAMGDKVRGTVGAAEGARDTDWYLFTLTESTVVTCTVKAEVPLFLAWLRAGSPTFCDNFRELGWSISQPCESLTSDPALPPGTYVVFVSTETFDGVPCGSQYQLELRGETIQCPGDINLDGATNTGDFNLFAGSFGNGPDLTWTNGDLTGDGFVTTADFNIMAGDFGCVDP